MEALIRAEQAIGGRGIVDIVNVMLTSDRPRLQSAKASVNMTVRRVRKWRVREVKVLPRAQRANVFRARRTRFQMDQFGRGEGTMFQPIAKGNEESALGIWIQSDEQGTITDRTVIKDVCFEWCPRGSNWEDSVHWWQHQDPLNKVLCEARIMERLRAAGSNDVLELRVWRLLVEHLVFRMHIEYCPYGDTDEMLKRFERARRPIPEPFIWRIFESLVNAGLLMEQGHLTVPEDPWLGIIHMDIKPANVFIGLRPAIVPDRDNWAAFPSTKLGDYGMAIATSLDDDKNPSSYGGGTGLYMAPEQWAYSDEDEEDDDRDQLTAKTNVYGVGITVMQLMSRKDKVGVDWSPDTDDLPGITPEAAKDYSVELVQLVERCVEQQPNDRPTFSYLRNRIRNNTGLARPPRPDLANGMRADVNPFPLWNLRLEGDGWAVGRNVNTDV